VWSGAVSDVSPTDMATVADKHPVHGETVCDEQLSVMWKVFDLYPARNRADMMHTTTQTSEYRAGGHSACMERTPRSIRRSKFVCIVFAACRYAGKPREAEYAFCVSIFVVSACELPLTEPPPEASSSVARECMRPEART